MGLTAITDGCFDEALDRAVPIPAKSVDSSSFNITHVPVASPFKVTNTEEGGRIFRWQIGGTTAVVDWENPVLNRIATGNTTWLPTDNVVQVDGGSGTAFWYVQNNFSEPHPLVVPHLDNLILSLINTPLQSTHARVRFANFDLR